METTQTQTAPERKRRARKPVAFGELVAKRKAVIANSFDMDPRDLLTGFEAAELLGFSKQTIWHYTRQGLLKKHGRGKLNSFYFRHELEQILDRYNQSINTEPL